MHQTASSDTRPRRELRARIASTALFTAALVGLVLPWDYTDHSGETQSGLEILFGNATGPVDVVPAVVIVGIIAAAALPLSLGGRGTRGAAFARAIVAATFAAPMAFGIALQFGWTGRPPGWMGVWVTFLALVGAFVTNVIAAVAGRRPSTR